ncbi:MAG: helix-turn-helix domain-containing protein [Rhodospirillaceae bacterium]|nr:helix-turn-helix domain-containing protein [Rhodospirillaceae bacterium]
MEQRTSSSKLFSEREAAQYLSLSPRTLQQWRWTGDGPRFVKLGRRVAYSIHELDNFVTARIRQSTSQADA